MIAGRRGLMAGATFVLAAGIGHFMQSGSGPLPAEDTSLRVTEATVITELSAEVAAPGVQLAADPTVPEFPPSALRMTPGTMRDAPVRTGAADQLFSDFGFACADPVVKATAGAEAMIAVDIASTCHAGQTAALRHAGLAILVSLDGEGRFSGVIPALDEKGEVEAIFATGRSVDAAAPVDLSGLSRVALVTDAGAKVMLSAYLPDGDRVAAETVTGAGDGGADTILAQVFSGTAAPDRPRYAIEAQITAESCGAEIGGTVATLHDGSTTVAPWSITMPDCDAVGDMVVLTVPEGVTSPALVSAEAP